jgi:cytoplasmic iron level regulating protein YaaA (DUF328/UPF0246 family)
MLLVISPAKTLDYESTLPRHRPTQPAFLEEAETLVAVLRKQSRPQLAELMDLSENLADLNWRRYREWSPPFTEDNARAALFAFKGDVYTGFDLPSYGAAELKFAQKHLRILSGLYGLLRPLDLIQPYRLEMGTALKTKAGKNLYEYWGDRLTAAVNAALKRSGDATLVNLASKEYFSALQPAQVAGRVVTPVFKDMKKDGYRIVSFFAKKARGLMCDYAIRHALEEPEALKRFDGGGYEYRPDLSDESEWVFTRDESR